MRVLEIFEYSNILFLVTSITNNLIEKYIFEAIIILYLYYSITLSYYY
jgi:hypothetical protein